MPDATPLLGWTRALRRQLDALGLDGAGLCRTNGIDIDALHQHHPVGPEAISAQLWQMAAAASGNPAIGLRVARFVSPTAFQAQGYALVASDNLREVFERIVRYHQVARDGLLPTIAREDDRYVLRLLGDPLCPELAPEAIDAFASVYVRTCRKRLGRNYAPLAVSLMRQAPEDPKPWHRLFRSPVQFAAVENRLDFSLADFESHLDDSEAVVDISQGVMLSPLTWERRARDAIEARLPEGVPDAEQIALDLNQTARNLERHLADEGCRFDSLLDESRQNLALTYLRDPDCALSLIGQRLGFADSSSFNRAFKRWTGVSAAQFRDRGSF